MGDPHHRHLIVAIPRIVKHCPPRSMAEHGKHKKNTFRGGVSTTRRNIRQVVHVSSKCGPSDEGRTRVEQVSQNRPKLLGESPRLCSRSTFGPCLHRFGHCLLFLPCLKWPYDKTRQLQGPSDEMSKTWPQTVEKGCNKGQQVLREYPGRLMEPLWQPWTSASRLPRLRVWPTSTQGPCQTVPGWRQGPSRSGRN